MLSLDDFKGKCPSHSEFMGSYKFEANPTFTKTGSKSEERPNLETSVNEMLTNTNTELLFSSLYQINHLLQKYKKRLFANEILILESSFLSCLEFIDQMIFLKMWLLHVT